VLSFRTQLPFDKLPVWNEIRKLPLAEQRRSIATRPSAPSSWRLPGRSTTQGRGTEAKPTPFDGSS
jgi:hypothetical protein